MTAKRCTIHYRRLRRDNKQFPKSLLSEKIVEALDARVGRAKVRNRVQSRIGECPRQRDFRRLMNYFHIEDGLVFGDMCLFAPGKLQALLELADESHVSLDKALETWAIAEKKAPDGTEYLSGISYWMVVGDHFYQIQHPSLQAKAMEEYLTWLLRDQSKVIGTNNYVELQAEFDASQIGDEVGEIQTLEIGGLVPETVHPTMTDAGKVIEVEEHRRIGGRIAQTFAKATQILNDLIGPLETRKIIEGMPPQASLEVTVNIAYRAKARKLQREAMNNLAAGLRNIPDGELRVRGRDGKVLGDDARLSAEMQVKRHSDTSSLLDLKDALRQMKEVHRRFLHDGRILPNPGVQH